MHAVRLVACCATAKSLLHGASSSQCQCLVVLMVETGAHNHLGKKKCRGWGRPSKELKSLEGSSIHPCQGNIMDFP